MIVFLHTSPVHIKRFNNILKTLHFKGEVQHVVNESLLEFTTHNEEIDAIGFKNQINEIKRRFDANKIMCTCSTYWRNC